MKYLEFLKNRIEGKEKNVPWSLGFKSSVKAFCNSIGVKTPSIYQVDLIDKININELPEEFVLKPSFATFSIGVRFLQRRGDKFYDLLRKQHYSWNDIVDGFNEVCKLYPNVNQYNCIIEELLYGIDGSYPPADIRCFCFQGEVGLIFYDERMNKITAESTFFNKNFELYPNMFKEFTVAHKAQAKDKIVEKKPPKNAKDIIDLAKRISTAIPTPFARIDLYNTSKGVYLGEITLTPGTFFYKDKIIMSDAVDEELGKLWSDALEKLSETKGYESHKT